jgi:hypothetical protein
VRLPVYGDWPDQDVRYRIAARVRGRIRAAGIRVWLVYRPGSCTYRATWTDHDGRQWADEWDAIEPRRILDHWPDVRRRLQERP